VNPVGHQGGFKKGLPVVGSEGRLGNWSQERQNEASETPVPAGIQERKSLRITNDSGGAVREEGKRPMKAITRTLTMLLGAGVLLALTGSTTIAVAQDGHLTDKAVQAMVENRLLQHGLLTKKNITVTVSDSLITLEGLVPTLSAKREAEEDAASLDEDYRVENNLVVQSVNVPDGTLAREVLAKVRGSFFYTVFDWIDASANNGVVTLTGWSAARWHHRQYVRFAEKVLGVTKVVDQIHDTFGPGSLGIRAARVIYNDPLFERYAFDRDPPVHIIVQNDSILLKGQVTSSVELKWAGALLHFYTDAFTVDNALEIAKGEVARNE
jgi:osmotically-inducible protein OsmY